MADDAPKMPVLFPGEETVSPRGAQVSLDDAKRIKEAILASPDTLADALEVAQALIDAFILIDGAASPTAAFLKGDSPIVHERPDWDATLDLRADEIERARGISVRCACGSDASALRARPGSPLSCRCPDPESAASDNPRRSPEGDAPRPGIALRSLLARFGLGRRTPRSRPGRA